MYTNYPYAYSYTTYSMPLYLTFLPILALAVTVVGGLALYFLFARRPGRALPAVRSDPARPGRPECLPAPAAPGHPALPVRPGGRGC